MRITNDNRITLIKLRITLYMYSFKGKSINDIKGMSLKFFSQKVVFVGHDSSNLKLSYETSNYSYLINNLCSLL